MDEFVERLTVSQHTNILCVLSGDALQERIRVEMIQQSSFAPIAARMVQETTVSVEQRSKAPNEGGADEVWSECAWTD